MTQYSNKNKNNHRIIRYYQQAAAAVAGVTQTEKVNILTFISY